MTQRIYRSGSLSELGNTRSIKISQAGELPTKARQLLKVKQSFFVIKETDLTQGKFQSVLAYWVSRFYPEEGHHNINAPRLAVSIAGILATCADWGSIRPWQPMVNAFATAGVAIEPSEVSYEEFVRLTSNDIRYHKFLDNWTADIGYILSQTFLVFALSCAIILCMTKNLTPAYWEAWFERRIKTFCGTLGDNYTESVLLRNFYPGFAQLSSMNKFVSANHQLRKELFLQIVALAKSCDSFISNGMKKIVHLMRSHEMQHLNIIDEFIMLKYPFRKI